MSTRDNLHALMEADRWIDRLRQQKTHLPESADLAEVETELRELASRLRAVEAERRPTRDAFDAAADRASTLRSRRAELETRMASSTAPARELAAMQQEFEHLTKTLDSAEDAEVALLLELEPLDEVATEIRTRAQPLAQRRHDLQGVIKELTASLDDEIAHRALERDGLAGVLDAPLRQRYEHALRRANVSGAAFVENGRCDGCRIALSPLDAGRVKALAEDQFLDCPECGRILLPC